MIKGVNSFKLYINENGKISLEAAYTSLEKKLVEVKFVDIKVNDSNESILNLLLKNLLEQEMEKK